MHHLTQYPRLPAREGERDNGRAHLDERLPCELRIAHGLAMPKCAAEFLQADWLSRFAQGAVSRQPPHGVVWRVTLPHALV